MKPIDINTLCGANKYICSITDEPYSILDKNKLLQAIGIQYNNFYENINQVSCAILRSLIIGHGFLQGNKRTAFAVIKYMNQPKCSDNHLKDIILEIAKEGGSQLSIKYLEKELYNKKGNK